MRWTSSFAVLPRKRQPHASNPHGRHLQPILLRSFAEPSSGPCLNRRAPHQQADRSSISSSQPTPSISPPSHSPSTFCHTACLRLLFPPRNTETYLPNRAKRYLLPSFPLETKHTARVCCARETETQEILHKRRLFPRETEDDRPADSGLYCGCILSTTSFERLPYVVPGSTKFRNNSARTTALPGTTMR